MVSSKWFIISVRFMIYGIIYGVIWSIIWGEGGCRCCCCKCCLINCLFIIVRGV